VIAGVKRRVCAQKEQKRGRWEQLWERANCLRTKNERGEKTCGPKNPVIQKRGTGGQKKKVPPNPKTKKQK